MPIKFDPKFTITPKIAGYLIRIEQAKERVNYLPLTAMVLASLRETSKLFATHYSTMIEGNRLEPDEIEQVIKHEAHFPERQRDEREVKGYYAALQQMEKWIAQQKTLSEPLLQSLHAKVMSDGRAQVRPTPYRDGQNVIRDSRSKTIVYMPPEAKDVPSLMKELVDWIAENEEGLPIPLLGAIAHYQYATIHPYYDGNGRTARLLTTWILHQHGYDLKGIYSLEEYYAVNLMAYYDALTIGPSHNYYRGRAEADITPWIEYFVEGMAISFERVLLQMQMAESGKSKDQSNLLRALDPRQRKVLELLSSFDHVTAQQIGELFGFKARTNAKLCQDWVEQGFLEIADPSRKARRYRLGKRYISLRD